MPWTAPRKASHISSVYNEEEFRFGGFVGVKDRYSHDSRILQFRLKHVTLEHQTLLQPYPLLNTNPKASAMNAITTQGTGVEAAEWVGLGVRGLGLEARWVIQKGVFL